MTRVDMANGLALLAALAVAVAGGIDRRPRDRAVIAQADMAIAAVRKVPHPGGGLGVVDASGRIIPLRPYRRIISTSLLSDRLLADLAEPDRVLAFSETSARHSPWRWRFAGKPSVNGMGPLEPIIALKPDLVLMNVFGSESRTEKLRDAGIQVFNLGELRGVSTLLPTTAVVGELLGDGARGLAYAETFRQRLARVTSPLGDRPRRRGIYLSPMGMLLLGGSTGTSYHDVLHFGGVVDLAAARHKGWIQYRAEEIAALDPDLVVTKEAGVEALCGHPGLENLRACAERGERIVALPAGLLDDPGVAILDAAELLFARAYPEIKLSTPPPGR